MKTNNIIINILLPSLAAKHIPKLSFIRPFLMTNLRYLVSVILVSITILSAEAQIDFVNVTNTGIYEFLDEMTNEKFISLNTSIKPYSSIIIYKKLVELSNQTDKLNSRQKKELEFYLREYKLFQDKDTNPLIGAKPVFKKTNNLSLNLLPIGLTYKDSLFTFAIRPIWGIKNWSNNNGQNTQTWVGAEMKGLIGKSFGFYVSLRDNHISDVLVDYLTLARERGGAYQLQKSGRNGADFNECIGGINYSWKWGEIGIVKDVLIWGENYNSSIIFSGRVPSFPMVKARIKPAKWLEINYFHGWLVSEVIDSNKTYTTSGAVADLRRIYRSKFIAANSFTIFPSQSINLTLGNSIIYSDTDFSLGYLIPVLFYKSVDHTLNHLIDNQNSQMFANISIRAIKHANIYGTMFIDEFSNKRVFNKNLHNFVAFKIGTKISNWPVANFSVLAEYTRSNPITYRHRVATLSFESNKFNLGNYLVDNSDEVFVKAEAKVISRLKLTSIYSNARKGNIYEYTLNRVKDPTSNPVLKDIVWQNVSSSLGISYEFLNNCYLSTTYTHSTINSQTVDGKTAAYYLNLFTPKFFQGKTNTFCISAGIGF